MDIIANGSLNLYSGAINGYSGVFYLNICVFDITEHCLLLYDVLIVKNHICRSVSDHIDNSAFKK